MTRSGVKGNVLTRTPQAFATAFEIAAPGEIAGGSPIPMTPRDWYFSSSSSLAQEKRKDHAKNHHEGKDKRLVDLDSDELVSLSGRLLDLPPLPVPRANFIPIRMVAVGMFANDDERVGGVADLAGQDRLDPCDVGRGNLPRREVLEGDVGPWVLRQRGQ